jgi:hypothetical protein
MRIIKGKEFDPILTKRTRLELKNILFSSYVPLNALKNCEYSFKERN